MLTGFTPPPWPPLATSARRASLRNNTWAVTSATTVRLKVTTATTFTLGDNPKRI